MPHNLTVTVEEPLWKEMKRHQEIRWSAVMKEAAREKLKALAVLERFSKNRHLGEKELEEFTLKLGKKVSGRS